MYNMIDKGKKGSRTEQNMVENTLMKSGRFRKGIQTHSGLNGGKSQVPAMFAAI